MSIAKFIDEKLDELNQINSENTLAKKYSDEFKNFLAEMLIEYATQQVNEAVKEKWISVDERLPEYGERVIVYCKSMTDYCKWSENMDDIMSYKYNTDIKITHWMPLPTPPNK